MKIHIVCFVSILVLLGACGQAPPGIAAPPGDYAALEKLAEAYRSVAEQYPMQARAMSPEVRKEFVQRVFIAAGYDYTASLQALAQQGADFTNQDHRDLVQLLFLPHKGLAEEAREQVYSETELAAVRAIEADLR